MKSSTKFSVSPFEFSVYNEAVRLYLYDHAEHLSDEIRNNKTFYEFNVLDYIKTNCKKGHTIVDVGANIGNHTVFFAKFLDYQRIFAFEPHPVNNEILRMNTCKIPNIDVFDVALGDTFGLVTLLDNTENMGNIYTISGEDILLKPLDYYDIQSVDLLKIDVEGFEMNVLRGGIDTIRKCRPRIFVEALFTSGSEIAIFLSSMNYTLVRTWGILQEYVPL